MAVDVEIVPVGDRKLDDILAAFEHRALTIARAYTAIVADFRRIERRRFRAEGPGWEPLAPSTVADRTSRGYNGDHPILRRTGALQDSFLEQTAPHAVYRIEPEGFFVGSNDPIAKFHQNGGSTEGRPPQRKLVDLDHADEVRWIAILGRYLAHGDVAIGVSSGIGPGART